MSLSIPKDRVYYLSKKQLFKGRPWRKLAHPVYLKACEFFGATLIDRTQTIDTGINFQVIDPIETISFTQLSFNEICSIRASEIADMSHFQTIRVLWSGGIDSTVALIALIKELRKRNEIARLKILMSNESKIEFPSFYKTEISDKIDHVIMTGTIYDHIDDQEINITGEHGDQLFGSDKLRYWVDSGEAFRPYEEVLEYVISRKLGSEKFSIPIIDYLSPQVKKSPIEIKSLYDYLWWMNFSMKWQNVSMRLIHGLDKPVSFLDHQVFHFFRSPEFQSWSISNHESKIRDNWKSYKYQAKAYIHAFHPNNDYLKHKEKEPSLKQVIVREHRSSIIRLPLKAYRKIRYAVNS